MRCIYLCTYIDSSISFNVKCGTFCFMHFAKNARNSMCGTRGTCNTKSTIAIFLFVSFMFATFALWPRIHWHEHPPLYSLLCKVSCCSILFGVWLINRVTFCVRSAYLDFILRLHIYRRAPAAVALSPNIDGCLLLRFVWRITFLRLARYICTWFE